MALYRPPQIKSNVELRHRYRFISTSGTATALTPTSLMCAAGTICTTVNSVCTSVFASVKINSIQMWSPPASQGASTTCSCEWVGFNNSPNREYSDTSVSVSVPACVSCSPPPQSLASFWQTVGTTSLVTLIAPTGTIIDIVLSLIFTDDELANASSSVGVGALSASYYLSLDPNATHRYTPVSLTTTT
jgi:hypothetical protein